LDGKLAAGNVLSHVDQKVLGLSKKGIVPGLATILVGEDPASTVYVAQKIKTCEAHGFRSFHVPLSASISEKELLERIRSLNKDPQVHGILVQLPLPKHICPDRILLALDPAKDADGLHPLNQGRWAQIRDWKTICASGIPLPCTPAGCMEILEQNGVPLAGKNAVVLGRSRLVGKPLFLMLLSADATVTLCHSRTQNLGSVCRQADILIAAMGRPQFVLGDWIKPGAVVLDVGINRLPTGLVGDVDFKSAAEKASAITPVPGGVGPLTVAQLLWNTVLSAEKTL
jgi:methylenetetrahydrofolate dehydrogenase (NADP+)/methenyltetrahydrofolate cyclohydrolase